MSVKNWGYLAIAFALIVTLIIIANIYYIKPNYEYKLAKSKKVLTREAEATSVKKDITSTSKKIITSKYPERELSENTNEKPEFYRNPFLWPGELKEKTPEPPVIKPPEAPPVIKPPEAPILGMICVSENQKLALLNNTPVIEGSHLAGHTVEVINKKYVVLSGIYGKMEISIPEASFGPPHVKIISRLSSGAQLGAGEQLVIEELESIQQE